MDFISKDVDNVVKKHIMFVMNQMTTGGAERVVALLANELVKKNFKVTLIITFKNEIYYELDKDINIIKCNINENLSQIKRNVLEIRILNKIIKDIEPDLSISFIRNVNTILVSKWNEIPVIISERNNPKYDPKNKIWRILRKIIYPLANGVVFQTKGAQEYFSDEIIKKSVIIKNPINKEIAYSENKRGNYIIFVGRICEQKNLKSLIKAYSLLEKDYKNNKLYIYGEGELRKEHEELVLKMGLEKNIFFKGKTKNIYKEIEGAKMLVSTSKYEGFPNVIVEALGLGTPVVSIDYEYGPREIIKEGVNGFVNNIKSEKKLAKAMQKIFDGELDRKRVRDEAYKIGKELKIEKIVEEWENYVQCFEKNRN